MSKIYDEQHRKLQDQFDSRRLADRIEERLVESELSADAIQLIEGASMFFIASVDSRGIPTCSYKGGAPGFVRVVNPSTILFPSYNGNGMFLTAGNVVGSSKVGLLFIEFGEYGPSGQTGEANRIRVHGDAQIRFDEELIRSFPGAEFVVQIEVIEVFPNCPRYIHGYELKSKSEYVPAADGSAPEPEWKSMEWCADVLPEE